LTRASASTAPTAEIKWNGVDLGVPRRVPQGAREKPDEPPHRGAAPDSGDRRNAPVFLDRDGALWNWFKDGVSRAAPVKIDDVNPFK